MEEGLLRFETYQVVGEDALIIHETFSSNDELKFHPSKGTAERYKKGHRSHRGSRGLLLPWTGRMDHQDVLEVAASTGDVLQPGQHLHALRR